MSKNVLQALTDLCESLCGCSEHKLRIVPQWEVTDQAEPPKPDFAPRPRRCVRVKGDVILMSKLKYYQQGKIDPVFLDHKNNPVPPGKVQSVDYLCDNTDVIELLPVDGRPFVTLVKPTGALGVATVTMTADIDPAEGIQAKIGLLEIEVDSGDVETVQLALTEVEDQPDVVAPAP